MSPEKANICIIDDVSFVIDALESMFETSDHKVLLTAQSKDEGLEVVDLFEQYNIDVVLLDTKLVFRDFEGKESKVVLDKIRQVAPDVKVITMSSGDPLKGGDVEINKRTSAKDLIEIVNKL